MREMTMMWFIQQSLPKIELKPFSGTPIDWIEFIVKFKELIHDQIYLRNDQRMMYLLQHLRGDAERAVRGFTHDQNGYFSALKRLKYVFCQRIKLTQAHLLKVTSGKEIGNNNLKGLTEFSYAIGDCLTALKRMCYFSDICSTDILKQAIRRLPQYLRNKWAEHSMSIRRKKEPTLFDLEIWLQARVMARSDPYLPENDSKSQKSPGSRSQKNQDPPTSTMHTRGSQLPDNQQKSGKNALKCFYCSKNHKITVCDDFKVLNATERYSFVRDKSRCINCLGTNHDLPQSRPRPALLMAATVNITRCCTISLSKRKV